MNQPKFRLLVSDIDGTLVSTNNILNKDTIKSIDEYRQAGGLFTLATGRNFNHTKGIIEMLQIDMPVILSDGAIVYHPVEKRKQILSSFSWGELQWITQQCQKINEQIDAFVFSYHTETDDHRIYGTFDSPMIRRYAYHWLYNFSFVSSFEEMALDTHIINIFIHIRDPKALEPFQIWCQQLKNYDVRFWREDFVCIAPQASNKGSAILALCEQLRLTVGEVAAIGDHLNDLSMSETVGFFAAMGNGESQVRESAQLVVPRLDENGVAYFIRKHLLKKL